MADQQHPGVEPQHPLFETVQSVEVEVVGGLVQQVHVEPRQQQRRQAGAGRLPAGQRARRLVQQALVDTAARRRPRRCEHRDRRRRAPAIAARRRRSGRRSRASPSASADVAATRASWAAATPVRRWSRASTVSSLRSGSWRSHPTVAPGGFSRTRPLSGTSCPAPTASSVDLPTPLGPTTPIRRPGGTIRSTWSSTRRGARGHRDIVEGERCDHPSRMPPLCQPHTAAICRMWLTLGAEDRGSAGGRAFAGRLAAPLVVLAAPGETHQAVVDGVLHQGVLALLGCGREVLEVGKAHACNFDKVCGQNTSAFHERVMCRWTRPPASLRLLAMFTTPPQLERRASSPAGST